MREEDKTTIIDLNSLLLTMVNGVFVGAGIGIGTTIGVYFANKLVIKRLDRLENRLLKEKTEPVKEKTENENPTHP